ncbi:MAG: PilZ domain-containing protein [Nitrospirae bacterium]|nr:PilZ domain-containing protein [Nitrospirota bacterium]
MNRRVFERVTSNISVRFYCGDTDYCGTITNLSENGMFISTKQMSFPFDSKIEIYISHNDKLLSVPVKVIRMTKSNDVFDGIAVQLVDHHKDYLDLVNTLRSSQFPF